MVIHEALNIIQRPYFTLKLNTNNVAYDVRMNDIPLANDSFDVETELPLNLCTISGQNEISVKIKDDLLENSVIEIGVFVREIDAHYTSGIQISNIKAGVFKEALVTKEIGAYLGSDLTAELEYLEPENEKEHGHYLITRGINLKTPFPRWLWQDANQLPANESTFNALLALYGEFHGLLKSRNVKAIEESMAYSLRDYMAAYFVPDYQQAIDDFYVSKIVVDPEMKLMGVDTSKIILQVFANGRMARFLGEDGESPIMFDRSGAQTHIDFMYCHTNAGWVQIR